MTTTTPKARVPASTQSWRRWLQRHGWTVGVWLGLFALVAWYSTLIPKFGGFQVSTIINGGTAWIFLAAAQAVVVIAGGLDLGVGGMLVLSSVTAARFMDDQSFGAAIVIAIVILIAAATINGLVGWIITVSKVPDIVVTLGSLYVYQGLALMILPKVGGGAPDEFRWLFTGSANGIGTNPWPAIVMIFIPIFSYVVYPLMGKFFEVTPLRKVGIGLFVTVPAFAIPAWIEQRIADGETPRTS